MTFHKAWIFLILVGLILLGIYAQAKFIKEI